MRAAIAMLAGAAFLAGCQPAGPQVSGAWVRLPAVPGRPGAAYFTVKGGGVDTMLVRVTTPAAVRSELHESMAGHGGMMTMTPLKEMPVKAGETIAFAPGGRHVMLYDISPALKPGGTVKLTVAFLDVNREVDARVVGAGDPVQ